MACLAFGEKALQKPTTERCQFVRDASVSVSIQHPHDATQSGRLVDQRLLLLAQQSSQRTRIKSLVLLGFSKGPHYHRSEHGHQFRRLTKVEAGSLPDGTLNAGLFSSEYMLQDTRALGGLGVFAPAAQHPCGRAEKSAEGAAGASTATKDTEKSTDIVKNGAVMIAVQRRGQSGGSFWRRGGVARQASQ
ncbi:MAG: hypothetical protein ACI80V_002535 [Rhodothermales bacterium]